MFNTLLLQEQGLMSRAGFGAGVGSGCGAFSSRGVLAGNAPAGSMRFSAVGWAKTISSSTSVGLTQATNTQTPATIKPVTNAMRSQRYRFQMLRAMAPNFGPNAPSMHRGRHELFTAARESHYCTNNRTPKGPTVPETGIPPPENTSSQSAPHHGA